jgi:VWFA-related protein
MRGRILPLMLAAAVMSGQKADIRVDVGLVTITCAVTDKNGTPAKLLHPSDFQLQDNGREQKIEHLWQEADLPLTIGLIVDVSGSQSEFIGSHRQTVAKFLAQVLGPKDRAFMATVATEVKLVTDMTRSVDELRRGVNDIDGLQIHGTQFGESCMQAVPLMGCGGTALWMGVYAAARQKMRWASGRKALIVLSDGFDTGSPHNLEDAIESLQDASTVVYAIKFVDPELSALQAGVSSLRKKETYRGLERLTDETGGYTFPNPEGKLEEIFSKIETDLRSQYVIGFTPPEEARDGRFHKLELKMTRTDLAVRARNGYYAQAQ